MPSPPPSHPGVETIHEPFGDEPGGDLRQRLYLRMCLVLGAISFLVIVPLNAFLRLDPAVHVGVILFGAFSLSLFWLARRGRAYPALQLGVSLAMLAAVWFPNGGSEGSVIFYFFAALLQPSFFFRGRARWLGIAATAGVPVALLALERAFPQLVTPFHTPDDRLFDLATGVISASAITVGLLWVIIEGYHRERERLGESRAEIRMLNSELEARVRERTAELERALGEIESFSYTVSHDLRAPLRAIDGFSSLVVESSAGRLDEESQRLLGVVRKNAQHMARLIDDLLAFSRAGRSELRRLRVDLTELARSAFAELTTGAPATPVELRLAPVPESFGDPALLRQVLANLLSNALKFTAKVDRPVIELGAVASSGDTAYFVRDNGAGFDMAFANQLFGVFHRLHGADEFEGTGVGLAIVRRIVERHGGRVWAEGRVGEGATFYFTLAPPAPSAGATVPAAQ